MTEEWRDIKGFEGHYQVSSFGKVKSIKLIKLNKAKILKSYADRGGYATIYFNFNRKRYFQLVHRLVAIAFISNPEDKEQVDHIDTDKQNNHVSNLRWCTRSENMKYAFGKGIFDEKIKRQSRTFPKKIIDIMGEVPETEVAIIANSGCSEAWIFQMRKKHATR